jgi:hypothetical protein
VRDVDVEMAKSAKCKNETLANSDTQYQDQNPPTPRAEKAAGFISVVYTRMTASLALNPVLLQRVVEAEEAL